MERNRPNPSEITAALKSQPGINITRLAAGNVVLVETEGAIYELTVLNPVEGVVRMSATDPHLKNKRVGKFLQSTFVHDRRVSIPRWIGKAMKMELRFPDMTFQATSAVSASVYGDGWHYDVF
jgi:hypothetical protein